MTTFLSHLCVKPKVIINGIVHICGGVYLSLFWRFVENLIFVCIRESLLLYACSLVVVCELSFGERQASWKAEYIRETQRTRLASNFRCSSLVACLTILADIRDYSTPSTLVSNEILVTK